MPEKPNSVNLQNRDNLLRSIYGFMNTLGFTELIMRAFYNTYSCSFSLREFQRIQGKSSLTIMYEVRLLQGTYLENEFIFHIAVIFLISDKIICQTKVHRLCEQRDFSHSSGIIKSLDDFKRLILAMNSNSYLVKETIPK